MKRPWISCRIVCLAVVVTCVFLLSADAGLTDTTPRVADADVLRFDAILELSAPLAGTHVVLCARYWVSPTYYSVAVVWAEPAESTLNFSTYPPTLQIASNERQFSLSNQLRPGNDAVFSKPLGERGVFRNKFNNYPLENIRFAETEALASRVYVRELEKIASQGQEQWQSVDLRNGAGCDQSDREVSKLAVRMADGRIAALKLMYPNGQAIKSINYEYSQAEGRPLLARQDVLLAERSLTVGYNKAGAKVKIGNKEQTFKELPGTHHTGGRRCTVEYEPVKLSNGVVALPACITVRNAETNAVLRTARMTNFVRLRQTPQETERAASQFSRFGEQELKVRELSGKYWQKDPDETEDQDHALSEQLLANFEDIDVSRRTLGERLKRINMLIQLDWIQAHDGLQKHFKEYLRILTSNNLGQVVLVGGLDVISTTIEWGHFAPADEMLKEWSQNSMDTCDTESILSFAQTEMRKRHYWAIAKLLEECSKSHQGWTENRFDAQALRCIALSELSEMVKNPSKVKTSRAIAQAGFASWSLRADGLLAAASESLAEAKQLFAGLDKPTPRQKALRKQLDQIERNLRPSEDSMPARKSAGQ